MKKLKLNLLAILSIGLFIGLLSSCGEDVCTAANYEGTFIGKYSVINIPFPNDDTVVVTSMGNNKINFQSSLLRTSFDADYNPSTGECTVAGVQIDTMYIDTLYFANINVPNSLLRLDPSCGNLYINLNNASVDTGTIDLTLLGLEYPLTGINLGTASNGLVRQ